MPLKMKNGKTYLYVTERMGLLLKEKKRENYSLETSVQYDSGVVIVKATLTLFDNETSRRYCGHALGELGKKKTLEATETHAIGRALASAGWFGDEFASANEMESWEKSDQETKGMKEERKQLGKKPKKVELPDNPVSVDEVVDMLGGELINNNDDSPEITFGKHKGKKWSEVDDSWLIWIRENNDRWGKTAEEEIQRRRNNPKKVTDNDIPL